MGKRKSINAKTLEDLKLRSSAYNMCNITMCTVYYNTVEYYAVENGNHITVCMYSSGGLQIPIKVFSDEDMDYNRVCADELVELLKQR